MKMLGNINGKGTKGGGKLTNKPARPGDRRKRCENVKYHKRDDGSQRGVSTTVTQDPPNPVTRMSLEAEANAGSVEWR